MAKKDNQEEVIVDIEEVYSKTEKFVDKNKKQILIVVGSIVAILFIYFGYIYLWLNPLEEEARAEMYHAQRYFEMDSIDKAIDGFGETHKGFTYIVDYYGGTKSANLAHYYLGICYLKKGYFEEAIDELDQFSSSDVVVSSMALGAKGDAYMEIEEIDKAISLYMDAAHMNPDNFTSPMFLLKAGKALEYQGDYEAALEAYNEIKSDYAESNEGREIDKFIARSSAFVN